MSGYIGVDNRARNITDMYIGVNGIARRVKKAYIGINGIPKQFYEANNESGEKYILTYSISDNVTNVMRTFSSGLSTTVTSGSAVEAGASLTATYGTSSFAELSLENEILPQSDTYTYALSYKEVGTSGWISLATSSSPTIAFEMPACDCGIRIIRSTTNPCSLDSICDFCDTCISNLCSPVSICKTDAVIS